MINLNRALSFSGHREDKFAFSFENDNPNDGAYLKFMTRLEFYIIKAYEEYGVESFYTGGATGFDLVAAEMVINLKHKTSEYNGVFSKTNIKHILVVPCLWQSNRYSEFWKRKYRFVMNNSDENIYLNNRNNHYLKRNDYLIENADYILCYCSENKGGTAYTIKRALKKGIPVFNIYDKSDY